MLQLTKNVVSVACMLHITFTDGSNPYVFRGNVEQELKRWSRNYHLTNGFMSRFGIYFVVATPKRDFNFAD